MLYNVFDKKSNGSWIKSMSNQQLANDLNKSIIRKFKSRKLHSFFKDKIWGADLAEMQLISKYNKGIRYSYVSLTFFSK